MKRGVTKTRVSLTIDKELAEKLNEFCNSNFMEVSPFVEHLKKLAQDYHDIHLSLETRYRETKSAEEFLVEIRKQEAALLNRFRLVQQKLLASLEEEEWEKEEEEAIE